MRVLVTGGAGFIGSNLVDALILAHHEVLVIDNLSCGRQEYVNDQAQFIKLDILDNTLAKVITDFKPEVVYHLAAQKDVRVSLEDPALDARINIEGSINLFKLCSQHKVKKIIFASTGGAMYDEKDILPLNESSRILPLSPYGIAKYAADLYLDFFNNKHGLSFVSLRMANIYGPRQDPLGEAGVVAIFFNKLITGETPHVNGTGEQTRDFVYVADAVSAFVNAMNNKAQGFYNIGTSKETSIIDLYDIAAALCNVTTKPQHHPAVSGEVMRNSLDNSKAKKDLDWQPQVDIRAGLRLTHEWFKTR